jgi:hypothetical protein
MASKLPAIFVASSNIAVEMGKLERPPTTIEGDSILAVSSSDVRDSTLGAGKFNPPAG